MPYWAYLWPAAYLLAEAVCASPGRSDRVRGRSRRWRSAAGWAWPAWSGWRAACASSSPITIRRRWISSRDPRPRTASTASRFTTRLLDWRDLPDERFPVILGADVIYEARLVPLVADLLGKMLAPGGLGLIASPYRVAAQRLPGALSPRVGLLCRAEPATARTEDGQPIEGTIYRVTR